MGYGYRWRPSKTAKREFAQLMSEIDDFCLENGIMQSSSSDSYYFSLDGVSYRVSNHTIEASNRAAFDPLTGVQLRNLYHGTKRDEDTVYIHASKTRIMQIYNDLKDGYILDGRGEVKFVTNPETGKDECLTKELQAKIQAYKEKEKAEKKKEKKKSRGR